MKDFIDVNKNGAAWNLSRAVIKHLPPISVQSAITILCIGSDRSTGDSLGPLVGHRLSQHNSLGVNVVGNLEQPVHARNLEDTLKKIENEIPNHYIIAIDACLGIPGHIGQVLVGSGPLRPGAGLKKELPAVGNMYITGVVNCCGWMEFVVLQNTKLGLVMKMAETIADGLKHALWKYHRDERDLLNRYIQ